MSRREAEIPTADGTIGLVALAAVVMVATYLLAMNMFRRTSPPSPTPTPPAQTVGAATASPPPEPTAGPTSEPTAIPDPGGVGAPADVAALQNAAWTTIEALKATAATGDVAAAQPMLGSIAPGLEPRACGGRRSRWSGPRTSGSSAKASCTSRLPARTA